MPFSILEISESGNSEICKTEVEPRQRKTCNDDNKFTIR